MILRMAILLSVAGVLAACDGAPKYESGQRYDKGVRTVAVPVAKNATFDRKVAPELTDALVKAIESGTHFRVTSEGRADTVLRATIRTVDLQQISKSRGTKLTEEMSLNVTVDYEWIDQRTGKPLVQRNGFRESAVFVASLPVQQPIDLARFQVVEQLASAIVDSMQADW
ncbi:MAG: hypothetical protein FJ270_08050 [Planctomycetes bacterium]|nr:hypothetical protein [Planctomycetota bacterium]